MMATAQPKAHTAELVEAEVLKWRKGIPTVIRLTMVVNENVRVLEYTLRPYDAPPQRGGQPIRKM